MNTTERVSGRELFADEEMPSSYGYLSGYGRPRAISEQLEVLRAVFPQLGSADMAAADRPLPDGAEGYFAIPRHQAVAATYNDAFHKILGILAESRHGVFYNNRLGQTGEGGMRQHSDALAAFTEIEDAQAGYDFLVIPGQFAFRHRGRSVRRARAAFRRGEFGLGAFHVGTMLLTHPERVQQFDDLWIDCPGDEFDDKAADNRFGRTPCFCYEHKQLEFGTHWTDRVYDFVGSASAFLD